MNRGAGKLDTSFLIVNNKFRVTSGAQMGEPRLLWMELLHSTFAALELQPRRQSPRWFMRLKYQWITMRAVKTRMSLGFATTETDANNWDFGLQLHKTVGARSRITLSRKESTQIRLASPVR